MNRWTYTRHRFADREAFLAVLATLGALPDTAAIVWQGVLQTCPDDPEAPAETLPGWHVDLAWRCGTEPPGALQPSIVTPEHPLHAPA